MVPVSSAVPVMIVFNSAVVSCPVTDEELPSVVARCYPIRSLIRRPRPVAPMPSVVFSCWIPIPFHPNELLTWRWRLNVNDPRRRWRSDGNTNRNLRVSCRSADQKHCCNKCDFQETAHGIFLLHLPFHHSASHRFKAPAQAPRCLNANCPKEQATYSASDRALLPGRRAWGTVQELGTGDFAGCDCGFLLRTAAEISVTTSPIGKGSMNVIAALNSGFSYSSLYFFNC